MKAQFEQLRTNTDFIFNAFMLDKDGFDAPFHFHPEYELTFILSSAGTRYVGNHFEDFKENDMVLLGPNLPHCWKNHANQTQAASAVVVHWDQYLIDKKWLDSPAFTRIKKMLQHAAGGLRFQGPGLKDFRYKLKRLTTLTSFEQFHYFLEILHQLSLYDHTTILTSQSDMHHLDYANNERIGLTLDYIRKNFSRKINLKKTANLNRMTEEAFSRFFSKVMRKSFFCYLNEYRINHACTQLIETDKTISEICYNSGYDTQPFFFRQFKKFKGCTPGNYRLNYLQTAR
ncbi:helix-turn-helix domain-containing protein [Mucilaginibacter angelicae]|uniref:Helix-turn-helix domain-containing protein n=1 Tax=Mucilaginibacter angelicae TaxID=869718 RepID=A0ABV6LB80_9SPHI